MLTPPMYLWQQCVEAEGQAGYILPVLLAHLACFSPGPTPKTITASENLAEGALSPAGWTETTPNEEPKSVVFLSESGFHWANSPILRSEERRAGKECTPWW